MEVGIFLARQRECVMSFPLKYCDLDPISGSGCAPLLERSSTFWGPANVWDAK